MKTTSPPSWRLTASRLAAASAIATGLAACAGPTSPFQAPAGLVRVSIEGSDPSIALKRRLPGGERTEVCRAPCGELVDARNTDDYLLTYDDVRFNAEVPLHDKRGEVHLSVDARPNSAMKTAGIVGMLAGSLAVGIGGVLMVFGIEGAGVGNFLPGLGTLVTGTVVLPTGGILYKFGGGRYSMTVAPAFSPLAPPPPGAPRDAPQAGFTGGLRGAF